MAGAGGAPWRDLPSAFGKWNSVFQCFRRRVKGGVFERVFACLSGEPDFEYALIDGTIVTAHQKASGARGGPNQAIGRSRGGLTTKIVALADALGNLVRFVLLPGQRHDTIGVPPLIEGVAFGALLGDKAFDVDWLRADLDARGAAAVIPPRPTVRPDRPRPRHVSLAPPHREHLRQAEGVQSRRYSL